ncbi:hypothetical protein [Prosthecobacter sp.]
MLHLHSHSADRLVGLLLYLHSAHDLASLWMHSANPGRSASQRWIGAQVRGGGFYHALEIRVPDQIIQERGKGGRGDHCFYSHNKLRIFFKLEEG